MEYRSNGQRLQRNLVGWLKRVGQALACRLRSAVEATAKGSKEILWAGSKGGAGFSLSSASAVEATAKGSKEILTKPKLKRPITKIRYPGDLIYAFILPLSTLARSHQRFTSYFSNSGAIPITRAHFRRSFRKAEQIRRHGRAHHVSTRRPIYRR
jgi:hypothetical protein